jgi:hypothetical protein
MSEQNRTPQLLAIILCVVAGCGLPIPDGPGRRITEIPPQSELIGTWKLTEDSLKRLKMEGFKSDLPGHPHTISLNADGKCLIDAYYSYSVSWTNSYIVSPGTWNASIQKRVVKYVVLSIQWGERNSNINWGMFELFLAKDGGRLVLWS